MNRAAIANISTTNNSETGETMSFDSSKSARTSDTDRLMQQCEPVLEVASYLMTRRTCLGQERLYRSGCLICLADDELACVVGEMWLPEAVGGAITSNKMITDLQDRLPRN